MKNKLFMQGLVIPLLAIIGLSSCQDNKLAMSADGTWEGTLTEKDEYGTPVESYYKYEFRYKENGNKSGGNFTETITADYQEEVEDYIISYTSESTIEGEYEVITGDLHMKYNLSSLNVAIYDVDYELTESASVAALFDIESAMYSAIGMEANLENMAEEIRKNAYKAWHDNYEQENKEYEEGYFYPDLVIDGEQMLFGNEDGRLKLKKTGTDASDAGNSWIIGKYTVEGGALNQAYQFKQDGTCVKSQGSADFVIMKVPGTWNMNGKTLTITNNIDKIDFVFAEGTYDEDKALFYEEMANDYIASIPETEILEITARYDDQLEIKQDGVTFYLNKMQ